MGISPQHHYNIYKLFYKGYHLSFLIGIWEYILHFICFYTYLFHRQTSVKKYRSPNTLQISISIRALICFHLWYLYFMLILYNNLQCFTWNIGDYNISSTNILFFRISCNCSCDFSSEFCVKTLHLSPPVFHLSRTLFLPEPTYPSQRTVHLVFFTGKIDKLSFQDSSSLVLYDDTLARHAG